METLQTLHLPKHLPGEAELAALNRRLRAGEVRLDWSDVDEQVDPAHLERLFAGLNLAEHVDIIGSETMAEPLMAVVLSVFEHLPPSLTDEEEGLLSAPLVDAAPAIWQPASEERDGSAEEPTLVSPVATVLNVPSAAQLRDALEAMVLRDLLGPAGGEEEEISEARVRDRYLVGMLAPDELQTIPEELEELALVEEGGREDEAAEATVSQKASFTPSSMGMSFCIDRDATELLVTVRWGHYQREESRDPDKKNVKGEPKKIWRRTQRGGQPTPLPLQEGTLKPWRPEEVEQPEVFVKGVVRRTQDGWTVTLFLVNGQHEPKRLRDTAWLFQPELIVEAPGGEPIFRQRTGWQRRSTPESRAMSMLYRRRISFAVGHGTSVHAQTLLDDPTCAVRLSTSVAPAYDIPVTEAPSSAELPALAELCLDMKTLAEADASTLLAGLRPLVLAYSGWIDEQELRVDDPTAGLEHYREVAHSSVQQCRRTLQRIQAGIDMLATRADAARAFAFMNRAMWQQRLHTLYAEERRRGGVRTLVELDVSANRSWRPFQLAFILLNLPALTDLLHPDRSADPDAIADLLWFPTGGGKTEAYLGLTAYTLAIRRLQGEVEGHSGMDGVAVIMRYTLRLLTLQQFQRASSLICACEMIRREDGGRTWGETPFRLGLWVGQRSTPNTTEESERASREEHGAYGSNFGGVGSPRQLTSCPWCGSPIDGGANITIESFSKGRGRTLIYCSDGYGQCLFSKAQSPDEGLPVLVVDEEIYRLLPALLIATVDKFAQLPWKGATQMLFGQVTKHCSRHGFRSPDLDNDGHRDRHPASGKWPVALSVPHAPLRPPDLIIQDELHLISGPLGTLVGLYETIVDQLATWEVQGRRVRPKVIAATATIRQAEQQMKALFLRRVTIFPPQGLDVEDNFFARQRPTEQVPGRRYLGICANGRRTKAALIRVYVAHLAAAQKLCDTYGPALADPWMTLVGYFNSMSELGGMHRLVEDDVTVRLRKTDERGLAKRSHPIVEELTSRKSSTAIPEVLSRLELGFSATDRGRPIDVLLATNMISVGVDVKRLGLMVVTGQPKTTAEYIQATSRVGRTYPGLVCIVYNWARPRDLSHYEQFEHYHATFYQQVEALSVTPFAPRALDRGLAALLTSFVRLSGPEYSKNDSAGQVTAATSYFIDAIDEITRRAAEITNDAEAVERVRSELAKLRDYWLKKARDRSSLGYKSQRDGVTLGLLKDPERGKWEPFTCLNSLRDVEPTVRLIFDERGLGEPESGEGERVPS